MKPKCPGYKLITKKKKSGIHHLRLQDLVLIQVGIREQAIYLHPSIHLPMPTVSDGTLGVVPFQAISSDPSFTP